MNKDEGISFFAGIYKDDSWKRYSNNFLGVDIPNDLEDILPKDVLQPLLYLLGEEYVYKWIKFKFSCIDNMTPIELANSEEGLKALKAFIMRMPN